MLSDDEFRVLLNYFDRPWEGYRKVRKGVKKRIRRHMVNLGCKDVNRYLEVLQHFPEERNICIARLRVVISRFFRDRKLWERLKTWVLPDLAARFPDAVKVWSAGCANGEEPYSLAVLLDGMVQDRPLCIMATDQDPDCLERARLGVYGRGSIKEVPDKIRLKYFRALAGQKYEIDPRLKAFVRWRQHDLFGHPLEEGPFQLIFLRNSLLTYYQGPALERAFHGIVENLVPAGYLVVGSNERLPKSGYSFRRVTQCPFTYQLAGKS